MKLFKWHNQSSWRRCIIIAKGLFGDHLFSYLYIGNGRLMDDDEYMKI